MIGSLHYCDPVLGGPASDARGLDFSSSSIFSSRSAISASILSNFSLRSPL